MFFRFVGGKGVATALGVLLGLSGWLGLATGAVWLLAALVWRYSSLSSLLASLLAPVLYLMGGDSLWVMDKSIVVAIAAMSAMLLWRHAENIGRLLKGTESKLGAKKAT